MKKSALSTWFVSSMRIIFFMLLVVVTILSLISNPEQVKSGTAFAKWVSQQLFGTKAMADKVSHFIAYSVLGFVSVLAMIRPFGRLILVPVLLIAYSGLIELAQGAGGVRDADLIDLFANMGGAVTGVVLGGAVILISKQIFKPVAS